MNSVISRLLRSCGAFFEEVSPRYVIQKYEAGFQKLIPGSDPYRIACLRLMIAYSEVGRSREARRKYELLVSFAFGAELDRAGCEGWGLLQIARFQRKEFDTVRAEVTARQAVEVASRHRAEVIIRLLRIDFPQCFNGIG